ncbi:MAG TPA: cytochrome c peroxidase [Nitrospirota bacterium]|nr:cytochrome c peroxidase [Nitrospirota bacterium]
MRSMKVLFFFLLVVLLGVGGAFAVEDASLELGKQLFNDPKLGTSGKSCSTCHVDGKGLSNAGTMNGLPGIINACITHNLKGNALDVNSVEMKSMILYIKSLGQK